MASLQLDEPGNWRLRFQNVSCLVSSQQSEQHQILHNISGSCYAGRLLAIMGPSGSGKTTLLDVMSGNWAAGNLTGTVHLTDGSTVVESIGKKSCYVMQTDILWSTATVREAVLTSALLRLPREMSKRDKIQRVQDTLQQLDLLSCADVLIGDPSIGLRGISGGQRRRTSVAIELVKNPLLVLLDEPTSGLDSETALALMSCLGSLARSGRIVAATIHQPNSDIADCFEDFLLLSGGKTIYSGPWNASVGHFRVAGYACPMYKNPTDYFMTLASKPETRDLLSQHWATHGLATMGSSSPTAPAATVNPFQPMADADTHVRSSGRLDQSSALDSISQTPHKGAVTLSMPPTPGSTSSPLLNTLSGSTQAASPTSSPSFRSPRALRPLSLRVVSALANPANANVSQAPMTHQLWVLVKRFVLAWWRNPTMLTSEGVEYFVMALFIGLIYLQMGHDLPNAALDRHSSLFFVISAISFVPSYTAVVTWDKERQLLKRELMNGTYRLLPFFTAKTMTTWAAETCMAIMFAVITYFLAGFQRVASKFLVYLITIILFTLMSETVGLLCAVCTQSIDGAITASTLVIMACLSFNGFFVRNIPPYFQWLKAMSYFTYAYAAMLENEFDGLKLVEKGQRVDGWPGQVPKAMRNDLGVWANVTALAGILGASRLLALMVLTVTSRLKRV